MSAAGNIKNMRIQGASEIAIFALKHLREFSRKHGFGNDFEHECHRLAEARPTAVTLHNVIHELLKKNRSEKRINELIKSLETSREKIAKNGSRIFRRTANSKLLNSKTASRFPKLQRSSYATQVSYNKKAVVMTHCHSHEVVEFLKAHKNKIKFVYVTETRPFQQGVMTTIDFAKAGISVRYIVDSAIGFFMLHTDFILVGADALRKEGAINKIGTLPLCVTAKAFHKKVYVIADSYKIDKREHLHIEERSPKEIYGTVKGEGKIASLLRSSVKILNPVFDVTPWHYIDGVVTEKGVWKHDKIKRILK